MGCMFLNTSGFASESFCPLTAGLKYWTSEVYQKEASVKMQKNKEYHDK